MRKGGMKKDIAPIIFFIMTLFSILLIAAYDFKNSLPVDPGLTASQKEVQKHTGDVNDALRKGDLELTEARYYINK